MNDQWITNLDIINIKFYNSTNPLRICCFNCNIQQWFKDNNITDISQLNGKTRATKIEDVKLITTPNSIKYLKFSTWDEWLDNLYPNFGVVKHDKKTHFFEGRLVQTHYQLLNTLQMSKDEVNEFLSEALDFAQLLRNNPEVVRYYIKYPDIDELDPLSQSMNSKNDVVYNLMSINDNFTKTKYYKDFLIDLLRSYYKNLKNGHVYVNGNYSTLLGNPIEMLQQSIGKFDGKSQIGIGNIHSIRFDYNKTLLAKLIYSSDSDSKEDKHEKDIKLKTDLISDIESETIGFSTMYRLLSSIEDKENAQIKKLLLEILFLCGNESFNKAIIQSSSEIKQLEIDGNDLKMFNIGFKITKKRINSQING